MVHENWCVETQNLTIPQQKCAWKQPNLKQQLKFI